MGVAFDPVVHSQASFAAMGQCVISADCGNGGYYSGDFTLGESGLYGSFTYYESEDWVPLTSHLNSRLTICETIYSISFL